MPKKRQSPLYQRLREILESVRVGVARSVNTTQVLANWLIGPEIVEEEQNGKSKAGYGAQLLDDLAILLVADYGKGCSATKLRWFRQFYLSDAALVNVVAQEIVEDLEAALEQFREIANDLDGRRKMKRKFSVFRLRRFS
jgi:hypothetical protein